MTDQEIDNRIKDIWNNNYSLPKWVKDRGYIYADPIKADVLITGINPSYRENIDDIKNANTHGSVRYNLDVEVWKKRNNRKWDNYWGPLRKMLVDGGIDLTDKFDYLDLFHFREKDQNKLHKEILKYADGEKFLIDELNLTQHIIEENIKPKLIVVKNKETWAYWGYLYKKKGWVWMGYEFEEIEDYACGKLCRIKGLLPKDRIAPEIKETYLIGTYVLFAKHINQFTSRNERPTAQLLNELLNKVIE